MFLKVGNQLFNDENFQYYEFDKNILHLNFNGKVATTIQQSESDFKNFLEILKNNKNVIYLNDNKIGINLKNISGIVDDKYVNFYFVDGSHKEFFSIMYTTIENQILGD